MARSQFGNTWWGKQWLNALLEVDFDNRLPRGKRYANNGSVRSLEIHDQSISARVQGSRPAPYRVSLSIPPLSSTETAQLTDEIANNPALIGRLLNRELDPAVLGQAEALGIAVFPASWRDVAMNCSCPDWASPCKHIAAVIYLLSREIDADPFQVFRLRGVDLVTELEQRGLGIAGHAGAELPTLDGLLPEQPHGNDAGSERQAPQAQAAIDYSDLPKLLIPLLQALPSDPGFQSANKVRLAWQTQIKAIARRANAELEQSNAQPEETADSRLEPDATPVITIDNKADITLTGSECTHDLAHLLDALACIPADRLGEYSDAINGWYRIRTTALHLLATGAAVPRLFSLSGKGVGALWLPALLDADIRTLNQALAERLPTGLIQLKKGRRRQALTPTQQACLACALTMDHFIREWAKVPANHSEDKVIGLLFGDGCDWFTAPGERGLPERVHLWLSRLQLGEREHMPVLRLDENPETHAFTLSVEVETRHGASTDKPVPLHTVLVGDDWQRRRTDVLQTMALLADSYTPLHGYIRTKALEPLRVKADAIPALLFDVFPVMRLLGIRVLMPKSLNRLLRPQASLAVKGKKQDVSSGFLNFSDLFDFNWRIAIGDHLLTATEFETLVADAEGVVRFMGEYVFLNQKDIEALRKQLQKRPTMAATELTRIALTEDYEGAPIHLDEQARQRIRQLTETPEIAPPAGLQATLRPYQERGFAWLCKNVCAGLGSILADDMGLGKTLQVITTILRLKQDGALDHGKVLIIVPTTLLTNWQREVQRFAPTLSLDIYHGPGRTLEDQERPDILLTTYGMARTDSNALKRLDWRLLVVDEAQNIKNPSANQTRAVKALNAAATIAMTGTPVENRLLEYWSIMDVVNRGYLGTQKRFNQTFGTPIQVHGDQEAVTRFRRVTAPFLMRRLKSDKRIITDLPEKIRQDQFCELTSEQAAVYESVVRTAMKVIQGESDAFQRQGLVLQMILALKQVCNHPGHYLKQPAPNVEGSGKGLRFLELLEAARQQQEKVLVFTQFREMGEILSHWVQERFHHTPAFLHGGLSRKRRDEMVQRFQENPAERMFILSLKAGGTGLNLTAASQVIHYDLWWNPAVEDQATDRAYRIGQSRVVQVHRLITRHSFEERINEMVKAKRGLAELTVASGEQWIGQLSNKELKDLVML